MYSKAGKAKIQGLCKKKQVAGPPAIIRLRLPKDLGYNAPFQKAENAAAFFNQRDAVFLSPPAVAGSEFRKGKVLAACLREHTNHPNVKEEPSTDILPGRQPRAEKKSFRDAAKRDAKDWRFVRIRSNNPRSRMGPATGL